MTDFTKHIEIHILYDYIETEDSKEIHYFKVWFMYGKRLNINQIKYGAKVPLEKIQEAIEVLHEKYNELEEVNKNKQVSW